MTGGQTLIPPTPSINVGERAPEFVLKDQHKREHRLSDHRGKRVLLAFHPMAWTAICGDEMRSLDALHETFEEMNTVVFFISVDSPPAKLAWAETAGIKHLTMLSDFWPHGEYASKFGLLREVSGFAERAFILIDEEGKVAWMRVYEVPETPDIGEVLDILREM
jgi:peroxiredoxin